MNSDQYKIFEVAAKPAIESAMESLNAQLKVRGLRCGRLVEIDHDVERGVGFSVHYGDLDGAVNVEMLLTDGDERAFTKEPREPACGLLLSVIGPDGTFLGEWAPYNYTPDVGTADPQEIVRRVGLMSPPDLAESIHGRIADWTNSRVEAEAPHC
ncbi:hypothetical protein [Variovorax sp. JS1663]|uniref:hypothetical protein n=1 Tax=Variovorax sp. JS1663 TaxID=1851577 RepID=UPI000B34961B|nr:hypothetical protein [Variovorax sp. JS1663]OUM04472.1 hypothetical protein A8M77_01840 [Variovorax sp. JS1663]